MIDVVFCESHPQELVSRFDKLKIQAEEDQKKLEAELIEVRSQYEHRIACLDSQLQQEQEKFLKLQEEMHLERKELEGRCLTLESRLEASEMERKEVERYEPLQGSMLELRRVCQGLDSEV